MYTRRKGWQLSAITVHVDFKRLHITDSENLQDAKKRIDHFFRRIEVAEELTEEQAQKVLEIADKYPVHKTLSAQAVVKTELSLRT